MGCNLASGNFAKTLNLKVNIMNNENQAQIVSVIESQFDAPETETSSTNFVTTHAQIVRNTRIPCPHWTGRNTDAKEAVVVQLPSGETEYTVGKVSVASTCESNDGVVKVTVKAAGKGYFEHIVLPVPYQAFKVLGLFGIGERLNTNVGTKPRSAFLTTCFALVNGGYSAQYAKSYLNETAKEKAEREAAERETDLEQFRAITLKTKGITAEQRAWIKGMELDKLESIIPNLLASDKWPGLYDATYKVQFKGLTITQPETSDLL